MAKRLFKRLVIVLAVLFALIQFVPYGRAHTNPPVVQEVAWNSAETRALAQRACQDCHSNETVWPWYSNIAPVSWLVQHDVEEGRAMLNFSAWGTADAGKVARDGNAEALEEIEEVIAEGEMPPAVYLPAHLEARLTDAEKAALIEGYRATLGGR